MEGVSIRPWLVSLLIAGVIFAIARLSKRVAKMHDGEPVGIGGWLIMPMIGFAITILLTVKDLSGGFSAWPFIVAVFSATSGPLASLKAPAIMSLVGAIFVILSALACLILIFARRKSIITVASLHYVILTIAVFVDFWSYTFLRKVMPNIPDDPSAPTLAQAVCQAFIAAIWIAYFHRSKRVKNTFVDPAITIRKASAGTSTASLTL
ncbi:Protein of unknown function [Bosea sp. OK403]|uniref:DUF2569 family protein n=1 Tax=Bosea sp. OK403 TaxID=1855286 RepID=UPI0008EE65B2|nr:DUF2569 family protein [Bosea sp. OK403]SFI11480.1 Protein of unknown function [Bosea sp. OK403]